MDDLETPCAETSQGEAEQLPASRPDAHGAKGYGLHTWLGGTGGGEHHHTMAEARKLGGNRSMRAKRMKRCICPSAKGWRFAPGKPMTLEEEASKGTLILRLETGRRGRVNKCGVVVKK